MRCNAQIAKCDPNTVVADLAVTFSRQIIAHLCSERLDMGVGCHRLMIARWSFNSAGLAVPADGRVGGVGDQNPMLSDGHSSRPWTHTATPRRPLAGLAYFSMPIHIAVAIPNASKITAA